MKIAHIADTHKGCRKNSKYFMNEQKKFYIEFFKYLKENNINTVVHSGDFFDNRKTVNFETLQHANNTFIQPIIDNGIDLHMIMGNHDSYFKSSGELSSIKLLYDDISNITIYDSLEYVTFGSKIFMMIPWIFPVQKEEYTQKIRISTADVCVCHAEMNGVVFQGNTLSRKGMETDTFNHFSHVFSGHYHKKSEYYIGSPYQMTFNDLHDKKRIIIYNTETNETEDVYLSDDIFFEIKYPKDVYNIDFNTYKDKIVRVIVESKDDPVDFANFIDKLDKISYDLDIKEEYLYIDVVSNDEINDENTLSVLIKSINDVDGLNDGDKVVIKEIITQLYHKAEKQ